MKHLTPKPVFEDERGSITDILSQELIDSITFIFSKKGTVRGNHYHKETVQWVYVQSGRIEALTQKADEDVVSCILEKGDLHQQEPMENHTLVALEDSELFVFTNGPRGGDSYEDDTYRLDVSLTDLVSK